MTVHNLRLTQEELVMIVEALDIRASRLTARADLLTLERFSNRRSTYEAAAAANTRLSDRLHHLLTAKADQPESLPDQVTLVLEDGLTLKTTVRQGQPEPVKGGSAGSSVAELDALSESLHDPRQSCEAIRLQLGVLRQHLDLLSHRNDQLALAVELSTHERVKLRAAINAFNKNVKPVTGPAHDDSSTQRGLESPVDNTVEAPGCPGCDSGPDSHEGAKS